MENGRKIKIETCPGVYAPAEDSYLMIRNVHCGTRVLEVGSGSGLLSVHCALEGSEVHSVDINPKAVECTLLNAKKNGVKVTAYQSDLFGSVPEGMKYDTIIFNPPYLPTDDRIEGSEQWDGGPDGFRAVRPFLRGAKRHIAEKGEIFMILSSLTDIEGLKEEFQELEFHEIGEERFFFEKILVWRITS